MEPKLGGEHEFNFYRESSHSGAAAKGKIVGLVPDRKLAYTIVSRLGQSGVSQTTLMRILEEESSRKTLVSLIHWGPCV